MDKHIFPLVKQNMVIVSANKVSWWAGYEAGRLNQRNADEKKVRELLDREKITAMIAKLAFGTPIYSSEDRAARMVADQILKLLLP